MSWTDNRQYIQQQVMNGTATPDQQAWYDRWVYSGRPPTKRGMLTEAEMQAKMAREALAASRPEGVSESLWLHANDGNTSGFNVTSVTRDPAARDALIEAGFGDWVKAIHEQHMDQNAGHAIGNGANAGDAWSRAQLDWYTQNYGAYGNPTVAGDSNIGSLGFGHEQAKPVGTDTTPYVPPTYTPPAQQPPANAGGQGGGRPIDVGTMPTGGGTSYGPGSQAFESRGRSSGFSNTGIGTASQNAATPFADAYLRAAERSKAKGPISGLFAKELEQ